MSSKHGNFQETILIMKRYNFFAVRNMQYTVNFNNIIIAMPQVYNSIPVKDYLLLF